MVDFYSNRGLSEKANVFSNIAEAGGYIAFVADMARFSRRHHVGDVIDGIIIEKLEFGEQLEKYFKKSGSFFFNEFGIKYIVRYFIVDENRKILLSPQDIALRVAMITTAQCEVWRSTIERKLDRYHLSIQCRDIPYGITDDEAKDYRRKIRVLQNRLRKYACYKYPMTVEAIMRKFPDVSIVREEGTIYKGEVIVKIGEELRIYPANRDGSISTYKRCLQ